MLTCGFVRGRAEICALALGWADPQRQLTIGYLTARLVSRAAGARHMAAVSDAILQACG
jgi:hypothetical protein